MKGCEAGLVGGQMIEIPGRQTAGTHQVARQKFEIGCADDAVIIRKEGADRSAQIPAAAFVRKKRGRFAGHVQHRQFHIVPGGRDDARELGGKIRALQTGIRPTQSFPSSQQFAGNALARINDFGLEIGQGQKGFNGIFPPQFSGGLHRPAESGFEILECGIANERGWPARCRVTSASQQQNFRS